MLVRVDKRQRADLETKIGLRLHHIRKPMTQGRNDSLERALAIGSGIGFLLVVEGLITILAMLGDLRSRR
jgi:hypothetical protein